MGMTSGVTSNLRLSFVVANLMLQKGMKVGGNLCFGLKVH
jgi:hypothetical protein